jgi:CRP-like cAMP-binding protein
MLTAVERVLILKGADLLSDVGPRHLLGLAEVAREIEITKGDTIYNADDPADALYVVVEGRVKLSTGDRIMSEVGPGEAFGTWSLVDESARGHRADCLQDGLALALHRDEFYEVAAVDLTLLQGVVGALAKRLRALVAERPEEARVESEGAEGQGASPTSGQPESAAQPAPSQPGVPAPTSGTTLAAAALGKPLPEAETSGTGVERLPMPREESALDPDDRDAAPD